MSKGHRRPRRHLGRQPADDHPTIANFGEAAMFALDISDAVGGCEEVFAIVAADGRVVRLVIDPLIPGAARAWRPRRAIAEHGDERVLHVVVRPKVEMAPPDDDAVQYYERVKRAFANLGRSLLDTMLTDGENVQSLSLALDPESPWLVERPEAG